MFYSLESWQMQSSKTKRRARGKVCKFVWVQGQMARLRNSFTVIVRVNNRSHWLCECGLLKKQQQQHIYRFFETRRDVVIYFFSSEIWVHVLKNMAPESRNNTTAGWQWTHHADDVSEVCAPNLGISRSLSIFRASQSFVWQIYENSFMHFCHFTGYFLVHECPLQDMVTSNLSYWLYYVICKVIFLL